MKKSYKLEKAPSEKVKIICKDCATITSHSILAIYAGNGEEYYGEEFSFQWTTQHEIIQCLGCESVSFRIMSTDSEDYDQDDSGIYYTPRYKYYPSRFEGLQKMNVHMLPDKICNIYKETILAIENDLNILSGIGIRALIEMICKDQEVAGKNLYDKIESLHKKSIITDEGLDALHKLRVLGNDSAHEVKEHNKEILILAFEIIKHMLDGTYILPQKVLKAFSK